MMKKRTWFRIILITLLTGLSAVALFVVLVMAGAFGVLPDDEALREVQNPVATEVYSVDGVLMGTFNIQNRQHLLASDISESLRNALVATEDARFYEHRGIDYRSIFRVLFKSILLRNEAAGGGSTLSQQLAKNLYPRGDYGALSMPVNKVKEMAIARRMEKVYGKEEILVLYLSTVPFGENTFGFKSASRRYFNKEPRELAIEETAVLVGMLKATHTYNPVAFPERSMRRRNTVLARMANYGYLEEARSDSLQSLPLQADHHPLPHYAGIAPYFREFLRKEMEAWCESHRREDGDAYSLYSDGLKIHTTIHSRLQAYAEESVRSHMEHLQELFEKEWQGRLWEGISDESLLTRAGIEYRKGDAPPAARSMEVFSWEGKEVRQFTSLDSLKYFLGFLQAGFLAMDVESAAIRAWVGGIDHEFFKYDHVRSRRQAGSVFKPLVFLEALEQNMLPCDYFPNDSVVYEDYDNWTPRNSDRRYGGYYSMNGALIHSVNTVSVDLLMRTGIDSVIRRSRLAGISSPLPAVPSLALGTAELSLLEMVGAYQAIANRGIRKDPVFIQRIEDRHGNILEENAGEDEGTVICGADNAARLTAMMESVVNEGTASALRSKYHLEGALAGKTGTTQQQTDGWFIGFSPELVAGAWVGGELRHIRFPSLKNGQGARSAMPIWAGFMDRASREAFPGTAVPDSFDISPEIREQLYCEHFRERKPFEFKPFKKLREKEDRWRLFKRRSRR